MASFADSSAESVSAIVWPLDDMSRMNEANPIRPRYSEAPIREWLAPPGRWSFEVEQTLRQTRNRWKGAERLSQAV